MYRRLMIGLFVLLFGCAGQYGSQTVTVRPDGIPICDRSIGYRGYRCGEIEIYNVISGSIHAYHVNSWIYQAMGPMAAEKMVIFSVDIENEGSRRITCNRESLNICGEDGVIVSSLSPKQIGVISRGFFGYRIAKDKDIYRKFSETISINSGEKDSIIVAFPLLLPPNPKIIMSFGTNSVEIPICWCE